jgi:hypothetical protein
MQQENVPNVSDDVQKDIVAETTKEPSQEQGIES